MTHRFTLLLLLALPLLAAPPPPDAIQVTGVVWKAGPPTLPKGTKVAVLEGDPKQGGMFTMRLKIPAGTRLQPHWHPRPERVTVLSGLAEVGFGDTFDRRSTKHFGAGSFYVNPPKSHHYLYFPRETVLQLTCEGPWELNYVKVDG
jgi:quercetin dioxygenase-like cupin family protein